MTAPAPNILVVDDTPANLHLLAGMLKERGYRVRPVLSGPEALEAAQRISPDLILLDINMPEMDGYQVCQRLKTNPKLRDIPVVFISALHETLDKIKAFDAGGVDYLTKPFQIEEVDARVHIHLELRRQQKELQDIYQRLKELEAVRDSLSHMVVHDMRSPLAAILMSFELLEELIPPANVECSTLLSQGRANATRLAEMTSQVLDMSRLEAGQMPVNKTESNLVQTARDALNSLGLLAAKQRLRLDCGEPIIAVFDHALCRRVIVNLLGNALKFTPPQGEVILGVSSAEGMARVTIADNGPGIAPQYHQKIFEKFGQVDGEKKRLGTGLGLTFCKLAVEAQGGAIGLESELGKGSTFWFTMPLPVKPPASRDLHCVSIPN